MRLRVVLEAKIEGRGRIRGEAEKNNRPMKEGEYDGHQERVEQGCADMKNEERQDISPTKGQKERSGKTEGEGFQGFTRAEKSASPQRSNG